MEPTGKSPLRQRSVSPQKTRGGGGVKPKHPFAVNDENRNHFPNLDEVLAASPPEQQDGQEAASSADSKGIILTSPETNHQDKQSMTGGGSTSSSTTMCLSIGARAALTEHLRHIAKHGLDEHGGSETPVKAPNQDNPKKSPMEEEWERLMDGSNTTFMEETETSTEDIPLCCTNEDGMEAVEIMTAVDRSDYFNTSRVLQLLTPEKLRVRPTTSTTAAAAITTRQRRASSPSSVEGAATTTNRKSGTTTATTPSSSSDHHFLQAAMDMHAEQQQRPMDSSFLSFAAAVDVSRLSLESDLLMMKRPDDSFQSSSGAARESDNNARDLLPPINMTPSRIRRDFLFSSPMSMIGMHRASSGSMVMMSSSSPSPHRHNHPHRQRLSKENDGPNFSDIGLSPIAALAGSTARNLKQGSSRQPAFPFPDFDLYRIKNDPPGQNLGETIDSLRTEAPSPISQSNLSGFQLAQDMSGLDVSASDRMTSSDDSPRPSSTPGAVTERHPAIVSASRSFPLDMTDRRRYRSVVPRRVLMHGQEEPTMRDDSFLMPPSAVGNMSSESDSSSPHHVSKSLLGSFDAVYADGVVDLDDSS